MNETITAIIVIYNKRIESSITFECIKKMNIQRLYIMVVDNSDITNNNAEYCAENGIKYSSFGLLFRDFGKDYLKQQNISAYQAAFTSDEIAYVATPNSTVDLDETDPTAKYAQFALVIDDLLEYMDRTFAAVCYMEYEGQLYLMKEARHSINSVVDAYLADEETMSKLTDNSVAILNALSAM